MFIHTVKSGETLYSIGRRYGVNATKIIENNGLADPDKLSVGQKLLILTPTRTYTVRGGDTLEGISKRFGVGYRSLLRSNPNLSGVDSTYPEEVLAIKYDYPIHGAIMLNGYYYKGCSNERLMLALAYSNYVTVSAYKANARGELERGFRDGEVIKCIKEHGRTPLVRIYDPREYEQLAASEDKYLRAIIDVARSAGYGGVVLGAYRAARDERFREVLFRMKKSLMSEGVSLLLEVDGGEMTDYSDIADGCILIYEKCASDPIPTFENGERQLYTDFAARSDSSKTFIDLSPFAYADGSPITHAQAHELAYKMQREIVYDADKMISHFDYTRFARNQREPVKVYFESPENIKAKLGLISELGYMGISFDIGRVPTEHLMMCAGTFACGVDYASSSLDI